MRIPVVSASLVNTLELRLIPDRFVEILRAAQLRCESFRLFTVISQRGVICLEADDLDEL